MPENEYKYCEKDNPYKKVVRKRVLLRRKSQTDDVSLLTNVDIKECLTVSSRGNGKAKQNNDNTQHFSCEETILSKPVKQICQNTEDCPLEYETESQNRNPTAKSCSSLPSIMIKPLKVRTPKKDRNDFTKFPFLFSEMDFYAKEIPSNRPNTPTYFLENEDDHSQRRRRVSECKIPLVSFIPPASKPSIATVWSSEDVRESDKIIKYVNKRNKRNKQISPDQLNKYSHTQKEFTVGEIALIEGQADNMRNHRGARSSSTREQFANAHRTEGPLNNFLPVQGVAIETTESWQAKARENVARLYEQQKLALMRETKRVNENTKRHNIPRREIRIYVPHHESWL